MRRVSGEIDGLAPCPALGDLQIEADALSIDQDSPGIDQLLSGAVEALVAAEGVEGKEELDGL